ncbi:MAG TPA: PAC2 family protein, partial [Egibacteraceae bacterium]|nr:PAC2 family protein [Egibacteraceae bacterium]
MATLLHWRSDPPPLRRPILLTALEGFVDAGGAAGTAAMFLSHRWQSEVVAEFDRDSFVDYRARRPTVLVDAGELRRVDWPGIELYTASVDGPHDAVLLLGVEPDMRWHAFCDEVARACRLLGVEAAIGLGAYPAAVPHTRPVRIMRATNAVAGDLVPEAIPIPGYNGPVGLNSALQGALAEHGIPAVGLWAEVPHYIAGAPNPGSALALVNIVSATLQTTVDTTELEAA